MLTIGKQRSETRSMWRLVKANTRVSSVNINRSRGSMLSTVKLAKVVARPWMQSMRRLAV